jgi:hypothetical protein
MRSVTSDLEIVRQRRLGGCWRAAISGLFGLAAIMHSGIAGCSASALDPSLAPPREVTLADFSRPAAKPEVVLEVPAEVYTPEVEVETSVETLSDGVEVVSERKVVEVATPQGTVVPTVAESDRVLVEPLPVGRNWPVESLVGQINGRPIFAGEFLAPIEDRLLRIAAAPDRAEARRGIVELVRARFEEFIDSELVISEAESGLSPEQKQGLFAWLSNLREEEIARRGGSTASAEESLLSQEGLSLEEFMSRRRDIALASDLLRRKIDSRVIVSWRDVELEYQRREKELNPPGLIRIGRIRLTERSDGAEKIAAVKERLDQGEPFAEVANSLGLPDGGFWREFPLTDQGLAGLDLSEEFRAALAAAPVGRAGPPIERAGATTWLAVLAEVRPMPVSLFDPVVQLMIRDALRNQRFGIEQQRYLQSLRRRWVSDDINVMRERLVNIALDRYFR